MTKELEVKRDGERKEQGASLVEYALLVALITVIAIAGITLVGKQVSESFSTTGSAMAGS